MLKRVYMVEYCPNIFEIRFDWNNNRHWSCNFKKDDSVDSVRLTLRLIEQAMGNDEKLTSAYEQKNKKLKYALLLAKDMILANDLNIPKTMTVINAALDETNEA